MFHVESERSSAVTLGLLVGLIVFAPSPSEAATLSLAGVSEGAQINLPVPLATTNLAITATTSGVAEAADVAFFLECQGVMIRQGTASPPYALTFSNLSAGKYFLAANVVTVTDVAADVSFDIRPAALQPANDLWSQAVIVPGVGIVVGATNAYATREPNEPAHADNSGGRSVWWGWEANSNGLVSATTVGSSFDTVLAVYTGTNVAALTRVAENDDAGATNHSSQTSFSAIAGTTYFIAVDGALAPDGHVPTGSVQLDIVAAAPPTVSFLAPTNGFARLVASPSTATDVAMNVFVSDATGIARVDYALDGAGIARAGILLPPYQWTLSNLLAGDYLLSVNAVNTAGLITSTHSSFSVISASPELRFVDATPRVPSGFQFAVTGLKGMSYELQAASNIPAWGQLVLWTNFDGALRITDTNAARYSAALLPGMGRWSLPNAVSAMSGRLLRFALPAGHR